MDQYEEDLHLRPHPRFVEPVRHHVQDLSQHPHVVLGVEDVGHLGAVVHVGQDLLEQLQAQVGVRVQLVPEGPDHAVQDGLEVALVQAEQVAEIVLDQGFQEGEEVGSDLGEAVEVAGDERQTRGKYHLQKLGQELGIDHHVQLLQNSSKECYKLLIFGLGYAVFKVVQEGAEGEDEIVEDVLGLLVVDVVAFLQHPGVHFDDLLFGSGHVFDGDKSEDVDPLLGDGIVDLHGVVEVALVELGTEVAQQHGVVAAHPRGQHFVQLEEIVEPLYNRLLLEDLLVGLGHVDKVVVLEHIAAQSLLHQLQLNIYIHLRRYDVAQGLVEVVVEGLVVEPSDDVGGFSDDLPDVGLVLSLLYYSELVCGRFGYFEEGVAGHLHDAGVLLLHKLEQLLDNRPQERPVVPQEGRVLPHHVHYAAGYHRLVLLPLLVLAQLQQGPQSRDEERPLLSLLDTPAQRSHYPRQGVQSVEAEEFNLVLLLYLAQDVFLHFLPVVPHQVLAQLLLYLVEGCVFGVGHLLADGHPIFVYHYQHLLRLGHLQADHLHHLPEYVPVYLLEGGPLTPVAQAPERALALGVDFEVVTDVEVEEVDGYLEDLVLIDFHHHEQIPQTQLAYPDSLLAPSHSLVQPLVLVLEKL